MKKSVPLLLCLLCLLSACTPAAGTADTPTPGGTTPPTETVSPGPEPTPDGPAPWWLDITPDDLPDQITRAASITAEGGLYLLAQLPEQDIALYGYGGKWEDGALRGVLLRRGEELFPFDQVYLAPQHPALPELWWDDFDRDGSEELAVNYLVSNADSATIFEVHLYAPQEDGEWSDRPITRERYADVALELLDIQYDSRTSNLTLSCGDTALSYSFEEGQSPGRLVMGNSCFFRREGARLTIVMDVSVPVLGGSVALFTAQVLLSSDTPALTQPTLQSASGV